MRPAMIHYFNGTYGGDFDEQGVPRINDGGELIYSPVNICQYGFMLHADYLEKPSGEGLKKMQACINKLIEIQMETNEHIAWYEDFPSEKYNIKAPWVSAMTQGECISFYLRMYQINKNEELLNYSIKAYNFLELDYKEGGVKRIDENGFLWYEEFPSNPASYVLNGFIYTIFGLYDLYRVTADAKIKNDIDTCIKTLKFNLPEFDAGYWSYYDLLKKELVRYFYQKNVHVPQLKVLAVLAGDPIFENYATKWEKQLTPWNYMLVKVMYRILPRWRKKSFKLN